MTAYYNEIEPFCADWLENLIREGLIADGIVDRRSIRDVRPLDLDGFTQCHFFAGIGIWSLALRMAGWADDRPVWTGSCPCQPFSQGGSGEGFADERHLWPSWHWLIQQHQPDNLFGEQVESPLGRAWLDLVSTDLEALGYAVGPIDIPSAGLGAPNIRQRFFWLADTESGGRGEHWFQRHAAGGGEDPGQSAFRDEDIVGGVANADKHGRNSSRPNYSPAGHDLSCGSGADGGLGHPSHPSHPRLPHPEPSILSGARGQIEGRATEQPSRSLHPWSEFEWLACADGKWRPTEPGLFPLAPRHPGDVGQLRAYGNAINPEVAAEVIRAYLDHLNETPNEGHTP